jgi:hypothetical protein
MRRLVFALAAVAFLLAGAGLYARGPIVSEYVVFIQLPELVDEAAVEAGVKVTGVRAANPNSVPLRLAPKLKLILKEAFAAVGVLMPQDESAETYTLATSGTNLSVSCTFRGLGDQIVGIALQESGVGESFIGRFETALKKRLPEYAVSVLPPNTSLERTREG